MRLVCISDTHQVELKNLPPGDVLIHAGDWCGAGPVSKLIIRGEDQLAYFCTQLKEWSKQFQKIIVIAGNHDFIAEEKPALVQSKIEETGVVYLNETGIKWKEISFWGSPIQPWFHDWAFNKDRGAQIKKHWDLIPKGTDVLITHGPPHMILDQVANNERTHAGCEELLKAIKRIRPKVHIFGHIHEGYGKEEIGETIFVNASVLDERYRMKNAPTVIDV